MGATGTTAVLVGALSPVGDVVVNISTPGIISSSIGDVWIIPTPYTADPGLTYSMDEQMLETWSARVVLMDWGFWVMKVAVRNTSILSEPLEKEDTGVPSVGGQGTLIRGWIMLGWAWY